MSCLRGDPEMTNAELVVKGEFNKEIVDVETGEKKVVTMTPEEQMAKRLSAPRHDPVRKAIEPILNY